jgi:hypothetical protein
MWSLAWLWAVGTPRVVPLRWTGGRLSGAEPEGPRSASSKILVYDSSALTVPSSPTQNTVIPRRPKAARTGLTIERWRGLSGSAIAVRALPAATTARALSTASPT